MYSIHPHLDVEQEDNVLINSFAHSFAPPVSVPPQVYTLDLQSQTSVAPQAKAPAKKLNSQPFECTFCFREFKQEQTLKQHILTHTGQRPFECNVCFKTFTQQGSLQRHISIHTGEKPFQCKFCGLKCRQKNNLERHLKIHTGAPKEFQCHICKQSFDRKRTLDYHVQTHNTEKPKLKCACCNKEYKNKRCLERHQRRQELKEKGIKRPEGKTLENYKENVIINCKHCGKMFRRSKSVLSITSDEMATSCLSCSSKGYSPVGIHREVEVLQCELCKTVFYNSDLLAKHMEHHSENLKFECTICHLRFKLKVLLNRHKIFQHNVCENQCHMCGLNFKYVSNLKAHYYNSHADDLKHDLQEYVKVYECAECSKVYFHRDRLVCHLKKHKQNQVPSERLRKTETQIKKESIAISPSRDAMTICKESGNLKKEIKSDLIGLFEPYIQISFVDANNSSDENIDDPTEDDNDMPLDTTETKANPPRDRSETHPFFCYVCKRTYISKQTLTQHFQVVHTVHDDFKCQVCDKSFRAKNSLFKHSLLHRAEDFKCGNCDKTFKRKDALASHVRTHFGKHFSCQHCPKKFFHKRSLTLHAKQHRGERNYECGVCEKKFTYKSSLLRHHLSHSGERKYSCHICHLSFIQKNHLDKHFLRHDEIEKKVIFQCEDCEKCFYRKDCYVRHRQLHDENRTLYPCPLCGQKFKDKYKLEKHMKTKKCKRKSQKIGTTAKTKNS